jgi:hypothetical protein
MAAIEVDNDVAPVFVTGVHRSGTTWLYQLLAETGQFDYVSAYHVACHDQLAQQPPGDHHDAPAYRALCETFLRLGIDKRQMDDVRVSPDCPEEYGFVLHNAGRGYVTNARNLPILRDLCRRVGRSRASPPDRRPVALKNPWDAGNSVFLKRAFPRARFVFIHRHPERVINSALTAARKMLAARDEYTALLSRDYDGLFGRRIDQRLRLAYHRWTVQSRFAARAATNMIAGTYRAMLRDIARLPPDDCLHLRYEDLCARPSEQLGRVLAFLGLDPALAERIRTPARPRTGAILPEIAAYRDAIARKAADYMTRYGYGPGGTVSQWSPPDAVAHTGGTPVPREA